MAPQSSTYANGEVLTNPLRQTFVEIMKSQGIAEEVGEIIMVEPQELKGEHMATVSVYVKVEFKGGIRKPKNLFVKKHVNNAGHQEVTKKMRIMQKEGKFLFEFLPKMREFCGKFPGCENLLDCFPKCLYYDGEMVVLENLVLDDTWIMLNKEEKQDLNTAKIVLGNLARFHAASNAFIQATGGYDKFLKDWEIIGKEVFITDENPSMMSMFDGGVSTCMNILKCHPVKGGDEALQALGNLLGKATPIIISTVERKASDKFWAIGHGDCWNNNMLFKKDPTGKVNDHLFVDLQITRLGSPCLDIAYFFYTSVKPHVRRGAFKELMQHYFNTLAETLEKLGTSCPWTCEEFLMDYSEKSQLGYFMNMVCAGAMGALKDMDPEKMSSDQEEMMKEWNAIIDNWVAKNPDKAAEIAVELVEVEKENQQILAMGRELKAALKYKNGEVLKDPIRQKFVDIIKAQGIQEEVGDVIMVEPPELKGEHMASMTVYVKVEFKGGARRPKHLFVKKFGSNEMHVAMTKEMKIMEKEAAFFNQYLPKVREFCGKLSGGGEKLEFFPKCLHGDDEMIVLENLVLDDNWIMLDKNDKQDLFTTKYVLSNLARFHAANYAYIQGEFGNWENFLKEWELVSMEAFIRESNAMMAQMFDNGIGTCLNIMKDYPVEGGAETMQTLMSCMGKSFPLVLSVLKRKPEDKFVVINHGDCHNNNMLFKKDVATGKVNDMVFVDMQITRLGSPNLDVAYLMYTSVKPEVRRAHFKEIMRHYFDALTENLDKLGFKNPWTFEECLADYGEKSQLGFYTALSIVAALGALKEIDMESMTGTPEEMMKYWDDAIANWIKRNPETAKAIATEVVAVVKENQEIQKMAKMISLYMTAKPVNDSLRQRFTDIIRKEGIHEEIGEILMVEPEELKGEHMASETVYVKVDFKGKREPRNLFVKKFSDHAAHKQFGKDMKIMEKEAAFFNDFLPQLKEFCGKYPEGKDILNFFPKCLYADDEIVVLNNLVLDDTWIMLDKQERQDLHTAKMVLGNLARFHAVGNAFIHKQYGGCDAFLKEWELVCTESFILEGNALFEQMFDSGLSTCLSILGGNPVEGSAEAIKTLSACLGKTFPYIASIIKNRPEDKFVTINHGDCWGNNMLFRKDSTGKVNDHIFVDLQITRFGSPNLDIGYFLHTSVKPDIRRTHFNELMQHYYDISTETLAKLGRKCPWTFSEFLADFKERSQLGFFVGLNFTSAVGALKEIDIDKMKEDPNEMMQMFADAINNWVARNPEHAAKCALEIVDAVNENLAGLRGVTGSA